MSENEYRKLDEKLDKIYGNINNQLNIKNEPEIVEGDEIQTLSTTSRRSERRRHRYNEEEEDDDDISSVYSGYSDRSRYTTGSYRSEPRNYANREYQRGRNRQKQQEYTASSYSGYTQSLIDEDEFSSVSQRGPQSYYSDYTQNSYADEDEMSYTGSEYSYVSSASSKYSNYSQQQQQQQNGYGRRRNNHGRRMMNNFIANGEKIQHSRVQNYEEQPPYYERPYIKQQYNQYPVQQQQQLQHVKYPPQQTIRQQQEHYHHQQQQQLPEHYRQQQQYRQQEQYRQQRGIPQDYQREQHFEQRDNRRPGSAASSTQSIPLTENLDDNLEDQLSSVYSSVSNYSAKHVRPATRQPEYVQRPQQPPYRQPPSQHSQHQQDYYTPRSTTSQQPPARPPRSHTTSSYHEHISSYQENPPSYQENGDILSEDTLSSFSTPSTYVSRHSFYSNRGPPSPLSQQRSFYEGEERNGMIMHELKQNGGPPQARFRPPPLRLNEILDNEDVSSTTSSSVSTARGKKKKKKKRKKTVLKSARSSGKRSARKSTVTKKKKKKSSSRKSSIKSARRMDDDNMSVISSSTMMSTTSSTKSRGKSKRKTRRRSRSRSKKKSGEMHPSWTRKTMPNRYVLKYFAAGKIKFESKTSNKLLPFKHRDRLVMITPEQVSMLQIERQKKEKKRQYKRMQDAKNHANKISLISAKYLEKYKRTNKMAGKSLVAHTVIQYASQRVNAFLKGWVVRYKLRRKLAAAVTIQHWWKRVVPTRRKFLRYIVNLSVSRHRNDLIEFVQDRFINYHSLCCRFSTFVTERVIPIQSCIRQVIDQHQSSYYKSRIIFVQSHLRRSHVSECIEVDVLEKKLAYIKMNILKRYDELNAAFSRRATFCYRSREQTKSSYFMCLREYNYLMNRKDLFMDRKTFHHHLQFVLKKLKTNKTPNMEKIVRGVFEEDMKDLIDNRSSVVKSVFRKIKSFGKKKKKKTASNSLALAGTTTSQPFAESIKENPDQIDIDMLLLKLVPEMFSTRYSISHANWCGLLVLTFVVNDLISPNKDNFDIPLDMMLYANGTEKIDYNIK